MMKSLFFFQTSLKFVIFCVLFSITHFGCEIEPTPCPVTNSPTWTSQNLIQSGGDVKPSTDDIPRDAYGIRISNALTGSTSGCETLYLTNFITQINITTLRQFELDKPGNDVTYRFRVRFRENAFAPAPDAVQQLNYPINSTGGTISTDFVLSQVPDQPDSCQFNIRLLFYDSTVVDIPTNLIYLK